MLATSGKLDPQLFGPSVAVSEDFSGQVMPAQDSGRRSIYLEIRRTKPLSLLTAFDAPVMTVNCERRVASTTSPQSLMLMNSDFVLAQAGAMAQRLRLEVKSSPASELAAQLAGRFRRPAEAWGYGYGGYNESEQRANFTSLPHWTGGAWQGSAALPDPSVGWVILHAAGGHAGDDSAHASIRRWTASRKGTLAIAGKLQHASAAGDGVLGRVVASSNGLAGTWQVHNSEAVTDIGGIAVEPGDTIDFVVDCLADVTSDSFTWQVDLKLVDESGRLLSTANSSAQFTGPAEASLPQLVSAAWRLAYLREPSEDELASACEFLISQIAHLEQAGPAGDHELAALTSLCQQLLSSNEFLYVE